MWPKIIRILNIGNMKVEKKCEPLQTTKKFKKNPSENVALIIKIPNIGWYLLCALKKT